MGATKAQEEKKNCTGVIVEGDDETQTDCSNCENEEHRQNARKDK